MSEIAQNFGTLNWSILILYLVGNLFLGYILSKKVTTAEDFFIGDKSTPWWAIGVSVVATYISAMTFLGAPGWAYGDGMASIALQLNYPLVVVIVITLFIPFFMNSGVASIYEYLEKRFGPTTRTIMSIIFLVSQALSSAAILYATALVIEFITGISVETAIVVVTIIALIYTVMGGIAAVIWTDVIQAGILLVGAGIIFYALIDQMQIPVSDALVALKAEGKTDALVTSIDWTETTTVWTGIIAMTLYHITVYGTNQMMVQRTLVAKTIGDAKKSFLMMGFAAFFIYFMFMLMGILFYSYYGGRSFEDPNTIILTFASEYGLPGLMGLIAAAVLAASMSSLDSAFNSMATISVVDFYQKYFRKHETSEHYLKASRIFTLVWALIIVVPAFMYIDSTGSILEVLSKVGSYFVGARLSMYGLGFFSKHTTERGLLVGVFVGFVAVAIVATSSDVAWPWYCAIGAIVNIAVSWTASLILDGRQNEWSDYSVKGQIAKFKADDEEDKQDGWYRVAGKVDPISYILIAFFFVTLIFLYAFNALI
ncbi:sodium/solute symporter [Temperatibacter marinus]|uniref:Sodium/solute symporter n=1 Tax=Temperatibacter marinus TaxID=1456591 RepID=A0AA52H9Y1_9PROT|nr:sodium/solute symporter [Temperatibacter marinus]WND03022.1 sodium/solute symporter [Temperatibacter marinus]